MNTRLLLLALGLVFAGTADSAGLPASEATAIIAEDDIEIPLETRRFLANDMILAPSRAGKGTNHIEFACSRLPPQAHVRFAVRPYECFGNRGRWISSRRQLRDTVTTLTKGKLSE